MDRRQTPTIEPTDMDKARASMTHLRARESEVLQEFVSSFPLTENGELDFEKYDTAMATIRTLRAATAAQMNGRNP